MTAILLPNGKQQYFTTAGLPAVGYKVATFAAGTSNPQTTWQDALKVAQQTNPIILDGRGEASIFWDGAYKVQLQDSTGAVIWTQDNLQSQQNSFVTSLVPSVTNSIDLGSVTLSWRNLYLGPSNVPAFDSTSGNVGYIKQTAAEITAGAPPTIFVYQPGDSRRYNFDLTGVTNNTALLQTVLNAAGIGAAASGQVNEVTLWPGTYLVNRLYMNYSNVFLKLMPGAVIKQTQTGITNNNTTGQAPAYAVIHVNPLAYLNNPSSAVTAISNVRIYGGGTVQGPYSTTHAYDGFAMGIVSNDCNKCVVEGITVQGCGGENILLNPSAWNTCTGLRILNSEVLQGGEVGINNARDFAILNNHVHDSWVQNGIGGDGDNGTVGFNRVRNMAGGALTPGGSGAKDIGVSREILYIGNTSTATGLSIAGTYAFFCSDDGATSVPKYNHRYIGNTFDAHNGPIGIGCDYNTALNCCIENNTVTSLVFAGGAGADFQVVAGSGNYYLRGNNFNPGLTGNAGYGVTNSSAGTPAINIEEGNDISGHGTADINWSAGINLKGEFVINSLILTLTGFAAGLNVPIFVVKKGNVMEINFTGTAGTSNATTMTLGTLPVYLRPTRTQNFQFPVTDNGTNGTGILQIAPTGVMTFFKDINGGAFTNTGTKGLTGPYNITCLLS